MHGRFRESDYNRSVVEFLRGKNATVVFGGVIRVNIDIGDGWEYSEIAPGAEDPFDVIYAKLKAEEIVGVYVLLNIERCEQYIFLSVSVDTITILIEGNRRTLDGYHTDYSWYFLNIVSELCGAVFLMHDIYYRDAY